MPRRLPAVLPDQLTAEQRALYTAIASGPRSTGHQPFELVGPDGALVGPFNAMLLSPAVGQALQSLGAAVRFASSMSGRLREMAILTVAAHWSCAFERDAHEAAGRMAGLTDADIGAVRGGKLPPLRDAHERRALEVVHALLKSGGLDDGQYQRALEVLGARELFELSTLVGYYSTLALQLRVFGDESA